MSILLLNTRKIEKSKNEKTERLNYTVAGYGLRGTHTGVYHFGIYQDILVLSLVTAVLLVLGSYLFNRIQI